LLLDVREPHELAISALPGALNIKKGEKMSGLPVSHQKRVYNSILGAIGGTPLVRLGRIAHEVQHPFTPNLNT
jgi:rhodanese-related sulfurtransferase